MKERSVIIALATALALPLLAPGATNPADSRLFMDVHRLDQVRAADVAAAHQKDLAVQDRHGVRFIRYWVDEDSATVMCLSEAPDAQAVLDTHREAHGLVSDEVMEVIQGE